ncbi:MAG: ribonuclease HI [Deltaproteobacteria bacterium]|nr:ribonuclease HI [Deltaproteobacteria bacterium]
MQFEIFSDGGSEQSDSAAGAAIVRADGVEYRCVIFLGRATNNEAEISGALLGFAALREAASRQGISTGGLHIDWSSDSQYTLKSATEYIHNWLRNGWRTASREPVKNQGLWHLWLELSSGLKVKAHHVRGHSGHVENELCDAACTWAIQNGRDIVDSDGDRSFDLDELGVWTVFDGRSFMERARLELGVAAALQCLTSEAAAVLGKGGSVDAPARPTKKRAVDPLLDELRALERKARQMKADPDAEKLAKGIAMVLKKLIPPPAT